MMLSHAVPVVPVEIAEDARDGARWRVESTPSEPSPIRLLSFCPVQTPSSLSPAMLDLVLKRRRSWSTFLVGVVTDLLSDPPVRELEGGKDPRRESKR